MHVQIFTALNDFQNSFTSTLSTKFAIINPKLSAQDAQYLTKS